MTTLKEALSNYRAPAGKNYMLRPATTANNPKHFEHRLLIVYDTPFANDIEIGEMHTYRAGATILGNTPDWRKPTLPPETIDRLLSYAGFNHWEKTAIAWQFHDLLDLTDDLVEKAFKAFDRRLAYYIKKIDPTAILFMGDAPLVNYARKKNKRIPIGRVFKFMGVDAIWTVPATALCVNDPGTSSLLGQSLDHAINVRRGKNRYTARKLDKPSEIVFCDTVEKVEEAVNACLASPFFSMDTEGENLNRINNTLLSVQLAANTDKGYFIPYQHVDSPFMDKSLEKVRKLLFKLFHTYDGTVIVAHGKYDLLMMRNIIRVPHMRFKLYDIAAGEFGLDENRKMYTAVVSAQKVYITSDGERKAEKDRDSYNKNKISAWSLQRIEEDYGIERPEDILGKDQRTNMASVPMEKIVPYGMLDVFNLILIWEQQIKAGVRRGFPNFRGYIEHLGIMTHAFASMEHRGLPTDIEALTALRKADGPVRKAIREAKQKLLDSEPVKKANNLLLRAMKAPTKSLWGDQEAWVWSPDDSLSQEMLFFTVLNLKGFSLTATGKRSIGKAFLKNNAAHPIVEDYSIYKEAKTFKSSFVDSFSAILSTDIDSRLTRRLRSSYGFLNVVTGRTSSTKPNLQNWSAHGRLAKLLKSIIAAVEGYGLIKQDFAQNEIRGYAIISKDAAYSNIFWNSVLLHKKYIVSKTQKDIDHNFVEWETKGDAHVGAVKMFFGQVVGKKHPLRQGVKQVIFGVLYGKGAKSLAIELALVEVKTLRDELKVLQASNDNVSHRQKRAA